MSSSSGRSDLAQDVTVVIPCWGSYSADLPRCLRSIPSSAHVLVIGDGAAQKAASESGAAFLRADVLGPNPISAARQLGLRAANTRFVCFVDADDLLVSGALIRLARELVTHPDALAAAGFLGRHHSQGTWPPRLGARVACARGGAVTQLFRNSIPAVDSCLIRTSRVQHAILFPDLEDEDWHAGLWLRVAGRIVLVPQVVATYVDSSGTVSRRPRDAEAMLQSHDALVATAIAAGGWPPFWRAIDRAARLYRRQRVAKLLRVYGHRSDTLDN